MALQTRLTEALGIQAPVVLAGMAGGPTTPALVAAVSNAGGLGTLGAAYMPADAIAGAVEEIRKLTDKPFGINLFTPESYEVNPSDIDEMNKTLNPIRQRFGIPLSPTVSKFGENFEEQLQAVVDSKISVCSFTFGVPDAKTIDTLRNAGIYIVGTATTVHEAVQLEAAGVDAIVAQGGEAGGHRGTFAHPEESALIGTMALVPQVVDAVSVPVIAAGGIMDGRGLAASLMLGASGVQMGTVFLTCPESGVHPSYKAVLETTTEERTVITKAYSGKAARGIETEFIRTLSGQSRIPNFPVQNALTRDIRQAAAKTNNPEYMSLWAGQGLRLVQTRPAAQVVEDTLTGAITAFRSVSTNM